MTIAMTGYAAERQVWRVVAGSLFEKSLARGEPAVSLVPQHILIALQWRTRWKPQHSHYFELGV